MVTKYYLDHAQVFPSPLVLHLCITKVALSEVNDLVGMMHLLADVGEDLIVLRTLGAILDQLVIPF